MKYNWNKLEVILVLLAFALNWYALIAGDYGYTSRNGFAFSRYVCSLAYIIVVTTLSHIAGSQKYPKINRILKTCWSIAVITSAVAIFFVDSWDGTSMWALLVNIILGSTTFLFTPFLALLPTFQFVLSKWTALNWVDIQTYNIFFTFCFSVVQLLCINRLKLHQLYLNLSVHCIDG